MKEIEIRTMVTNKEAIIERLVEKDFVLSKMVIQHDIMFDKEDGSLFKSGCKIRLRIEGDNKEITYKGNLNESKNVSKRVEINLDAKNNTIDEIFDFFSSLGYPFCFQVRKERIVYKRGGIFVSFDEWPIIGCMLEIEGNEEDIITLSKQIAPEYVFGNRRLKEFFGDKMLKTNKNLNELKSDYFDKTGFDLGKIELIL